tara:strand:+ start:292 stop:888 length:597 start_codon:yes stop_codon:yes gene_type:complete
MLKQSYCNQIEAGCDEAGRGCLAGPVVAAAVILPKNFNNKILNDSKLLSQNKRLILEKIIKEKSIAWSISSVNRKKIDEINILNASFLAMNYAIKKLTITPELVLIDGNRFRTTTDIKYKCIVKGDQQFMSIAAASILAKNYRDNIMEKLHEKHPNYNWKKNKGYPTKEHRSGIKKHGITKYHRRSFQLIKTQLTLSL